MTADAPLITIPLAPGVWHHPHLVWWAVWLRVHGYRGRLPRWAVARCHAVYPEAVCGCGSYALDWRGDDA